MKGFCSWAVASLVLLASASGASVDFSTFGGYATFNLGAVNDALEKNKDSAAAMPGNSSPALVKVTDGSYAGADINFSIFRFLKLGPRLEYLQANQGTLFYTSSGKDNKSAYHASLTEGMLGVIAEHSFSQRLSLRGGLWGGWGAAKWGTDSGGGYSFLTGSGFVAEVGGSARCILAGHFFAGLNAAYRQAYFASLNDDSGHLGRIGNIAVAFDYGGLNAGGELGFNF